MKRMLKWLIRPFWALGTQVVKLWNHTPAGKTLQVTMYPIVSRHLPKAFHEFTVVQLTDLHGRCFEEHQMEIVKKVEELSPDIVIITGDMFGHARKPEDREAITYLMKELAVRWDVYAILGNHEMRSEALEEITEEIQLSGVRLLRNEAVRLEKENGCIAVAGIDTDAMKQMYEEESYEERQEKLQMAMKLSKEEKIPYTILLAHKPELLAEYAEAGADLVFSGHAHGGLLEIPWSGGKRLLAPGQGFLPEYTQGIYEDGSATMVLSSGMGGPRLGLKPEIVQVKLFTESGKE